jgi:hypothetical protein
LRTKAVLPLCCQFKAHEYSVFAPTFGRGFTTKRDEKQDMVHGPHEQKPLLTRPEFREGASIFMFSLRFF